MVWYAKLSPPVGLSSTPDLVIHVQLQPVDRARLLGVEPGDTTSGFVTRFVFIFNQNIYCYLFLAVVSAWAMGWSMIWPTGNWPEGKRSFTGTVGGSVCTAAPFFFLFFFFLLA